MPTRIFVNLPVRDVARATAFFQGLGFTQNTRFSNDDGSCIVVSDIIHVMLLSHAKFREFTTKEICDTSRTTEVLTSLSMDSREEVDAFVARAVAAGATTPAPAKDFGCMYFHAFDDLDGHTWEVFWMDETNAPAA